MKQKDFNNLIRVEWKTLDEIRDDIFKELKKSPPKNEKHKC